MTAEKLTEYFEYLDELRESGVTNMFGARPYLQEDCDLSRDEAGQVLSDWMKTFSHETSAAERAAAVVWSA